MTCTFHEAVMSIERYRFRRCMKMSRSSEPTRSRSWLDRVEAEAAILQQLRASFHGMNDGADGDDPKDASAVAVLDSGLGSKVTLYQPFGYESLFDSLIEKVLRKKSLFCSKMTHYIASRRIP